MRREFLKNIETLAKDAHFAISTGAEELSLTYLPSLGEAGEEEKELYEILQKNEQKEIDLGFSALGRQDPGVSGPAAFLGFVLKNGGVRAFQIRF
jgi:recombinational DNA repair ATPase RecF